MPSNKKSSGGNSKTRASNKPRQSPATTSPILNQVGTWPARSEPRAHSSNADQAATKPSKNVSGLWMLMRWADHKSEKQDLKRTVQESQAEQKRVSDTDAEQTYRDTQDYVVVGPGDAEASDDEER